MFTKKNRRRGQGLVEYALIVAGVALICAAAISILGHKTSDLIAAMATILPGAHSDDNGSIISGKLIDTTPATNGNGTPGSGAGLDLAKIEGESNTDRLMLSVTGNSSVNAFGGLIDESR